MTWIAIGGAIAGLLSGLAIIVASVVLWWPSVAFLALAVWWLRRQWVLSRGRQ